MNTPADRIWWAALTVEGGATGTYLDGDAHNSTASYSPAKVRGHVAQ